MGWMNEINGGCIDTNERNDTHTHNQPSQPNPSKLYSQRRYSNHIYQHTHTHTTHIISFIERDEWMNGWMNGWMDIVYSRLLCQLFGHDVGGRGMHIYDNGIMN